MYKKRYYNKKDKWGNIILDENGHAKVFEEEIPLTPSEIEKENAFIDERNEKQHITWKNQCINAFNQLVNKIAVGLEEELSTEEKIWYSNMINSTFKTKEEDYMIIPNRIEVLL